MKAIAAVTKNWGLGKDNKLLVSIPEDMKFFRETTTGSVVIMGRKTLESFPGGRPLKNRINVVLTRDPSYAKEGTVIIRDISELDAVLEQYPDREAFVIGGASIYRQMADMCDTIYITKVDSEPDADAFFPNLDEDPSWQAAQESEEKVYEGLRYKFVTYTKAESEDDMMQE